MLTGDENIVDIDFIVQWQIDPAKPRGLSSSTSRIPPAPLRPWPRARCARSIGRRNIQPVLTDRSRRDRERGAPADAGHAQRLQGRRAHPPGPAPEGRPAAAGHRRLPRRPGRARRPGAPAATRPQTYANRVVPEARRPGGQLVQAAEAFKEQTVAEAQGQASRFISVYEQYKAAPGVTRERLYPGDDGARAGRRPTRSSSTDGQWPGRGALSAARASCSRGAPAAGAAPARREPDAMNGSSPSHRSSSSSLRRRAARLLYACDLRGPADPVGPGAAPRRGAARSTEPGLYFKLPAPIEQGDRCSTTASSISTCRRRKSSPRTRSGSWSMPSRATASSDPLRFYQAVNSIAARQLAARLDRQSARFARCWRRRPSPPWSATSARG